LSVGRNRQHRGQRRSPYRFHDDLPIVLEPYLSLAHPAKT
jgi:hypothetical protein